MNNIRDNLTWHNGCNVNEYFVTAKTDLNLAKKLTYLPSLFKIQGVRKVKKNILVINYKFSKGWRKRVLILQVFKITIYFWTT